MKKELLKPLARILLAAITFSFSSVLASSTNIDTSFATKTPVGFNNPVRVIKTQSDRKVLVGGTFTTYE
jgi:hypothetical protein